MTAFPHTTVQAAHESWLAASTAEPVTIAWYRRMTDPLIDCLGPDRPVQSINAADLRAWREHLQHKPAAVGDYRHKRLERRRLSPATINSHLRAARIWLRWLTNEGYIAGIPANTLKPIRQQRRRIKAISAGDRDAILRHAAADPRDHALVRLLADTGCRLAGIANLTVTDLAFRRRRGRWLSWADAQWQLEETADYDDWRGRAYVVEKGAKGRYVYFGVKTSAAMLQWLALRLPASPADRVFVGQRGPLSESGVAQVIKRLSAAAGTTGPTNPHAWRHGFAKGMIRNGADISSVSELLGHENTRITADYYLVWSEDELAAAHERYGWLDE